MKEVDQHKTIEDIFSDNDTFLIRSILKSQGIDENKLKCISCNNSKHKGYNDYIFKYIYKIKLRIFNTEKDVRVHFFTSNTRKGYDAPATEFQKNLVPALNHN